MSIFNLITQDKYYFKVCLKFTGNTDDAHDLMMDTALTIHDKDYSLDNIRSLFYIIAKNKHIDNIKKKIVGEETVVVDDRQQYENDIIDFALTYAQSKAKSKRDFVTLEIFKLYLQHKSQTKVAEITGINRTTITNQIKRFKKNAIKLWNSRSK